MNWFERKINAMRNRVESIKDTIDIIDELRPDSNANEGIFNELLDLMEYKLKTTSDEIEEIRRMICKLKKEE